MSNNTVHVKCKRGNDKATAGQSCSSLMAEKLSPDGSQIVQFKCKICGFIWNVAVGGLSPI
jgi:hypothetical protein